MAIRILGEEQSEIFGEKIHKNQIVVVAPDEILAQILRHNNMKTFWCKSAFELVEQHEKELENALILVQKGVRTPDDFSYFEYEPKKELSTIGKITEYYNINENDQEEEKVDIESILHKRIIKI